MSCIGLPSTRRPLFCVLCSAMSPDTGADIVIPYQVAGFHALLLCALWYTLPGCWVPCIAAGGTLLYHTRLPGSMHRCIGHMVIPCQVAGSMHGCCVYTVIQRQVAGFHPLLLGEHCCTRLLGSLQCCCVLLLFSICYCHALYGICHVWYRHM